MTTLLWLSLFLILEGMRVYVPKRLPLHQQKTTMLIRALMIGVFFLMAFTQEPISHVVYVGFLGYAVIVVIVWLVRVLRHVPLQTPTLKGVLVKAFVWGLIFTPLWVFPNHPPLSPTGAYDVELFTFHVLDEQAHEAFAHREEAREIEVFCYYPKSSDRERAIILYSHGGISTPQSNASLLIELASHGHVACTLSHPFHTLVTTSSQGTQVRMDRAYFDELMQEDVRSNPTQSLAYYQEWMRVRTHDLTLVMRDLDGQKAQNEHFLQWANLSEFIVMGHSLGGSAALCLSRQSPNIKAVVALESPYLCDLEAVAQGAFILKEAQWSVPSLHVYSDTIWGDLHTWPQYQRNVEIIALNHPNHIIHHIEGSGHFSLTDLGLLSPVLNRFLNRHSTLLSPTETLMSVNEAVLAFIQTLSD